MAPRGRWRPYVLCLGVAALLAPFQHRLDDAATDISPVAGSESATVDQILATEFSSSLLDPSVLVITGLPIPANTDSGRAIVRALVAPLAASPLVDGIVSPANSLDTLLVGSDRATAIALVGLRRGVPSALDSVRALTARLAQQHPQLRLRWTGQTALVRDLRTFGATEARRAELRVLPVTAIVSIIAFPSVGDAVLAFVAAGLSLTITLGFFGLAAPVISPSSFTRVIVPMVAMALTVDYVLYLTWRRRRRCGSPHVGKDDRNRRMRRDHVFRGPNRRAPPGFAIGGTGRCRRLRRGGGGGHRVYGWTRGRRR
jgi:RND superfamily putative drug exporter